MTIQTNVMAKARTRFNQVVDRILTEIDVAYPMASIEGVNIALIYEEIGTIPGQAQSILSVTRCEADIQLGFAEVAEIESDPTHLIPEIIHNHGAHTIDEGVYWHPCPASSAKEIVTFNIGLETAWNGDQEGKVR